MLVSIWAFRSDPVDLKYHQWRFAKSNATPRDQHRSRESLGERIAVARDSSARARIVIPLVQELRFPGVAEDVTARVVKLVVDFHSCELDTVVIPELIRALRTKNASVRFHIHETLRALQAADFLDKPLPTGLPEWTPAPEETPAEIDVKVALWQRWWQATS
jgi:hypothetical protein